MASKNRSLWDRAKEENGRAGTVEEDTAEPRREKEILIPRIPCNQRPQIILAVAQTLCQMHSLIDDTVKKKKMIFLPLNHQRETKGGWPTGVSNFLHNPLMRLACLLKW